jgi:biotin transport system substrate-specific component
MTTFGTVSHDTRSAAMPKAVVSLFAVAAFAILTAVGAQISIPAVPVPFTLQTFFVLLSGALLGARRGAAAQLAYIAAGAFGAPVFAGFKGSFLHLLGPTGGYLIAFPAAAFLAGSLVESSVAKRLPTMIASIASMAIAMMLIFLAGVAQLNLVVFHNWNAALAAGFLHLQVWDAVKILAAAAVYAQLQRRFSHE